MLPLPAVAFALEGDGFGGAAAVLVALEGLGLAAIVVTGLRGDTLARNTWPWENTLEPRPQNPTRKEFPPPILHQNHQNHGSDKRRLSPNITTTYHHGEIHSRPA
jgi:hypothetical protein